MCQEDRNRQARLFFCRSPTLSKAEQQHEMEERTGHFGSPDFDPSKNQTERAIQLD